MKREILFRGKRIDNGEWVNGSLVMVCDGETLKRYPCIVISYNHDTFDWHEVDPKTVGQFTGLTDKNGVKIFEGDTCKFETCSGKYQRKEVEFYKYGFFVGDYPVGNNCEVITNIHDNPELI